MADRVCGHIKALHKELQELNQMNQPPQSSWVQDDISDSQNVDNRNSSSKGIISNRFTKDPVVVTAPKKVSAGLDLQLSSMAPLVSKNSSQALFLRILKVIVQLRDAVRNFEKKKRKEAEEEARANNRQENNHESEGIAPNPTAMDVSDIPPPPPSVPISALHLMRNAASSRTSAPIPPTPSASTISRSEEEEAPIPPLSNQLDLDYLWDTLSQCLTELQLTQDTHAVLVLQPAVEAFFLVHASGVETETTERSEQDSLPPPPALFHPHIRHATSTPVNRSPQPTVSQEDEFSRRSSVMEIYPVDSNELFSSVMNANQEAANQDLPPSQNPASSSQSNVDLTSPGYNMYMARTSHLTALLERREESEGNQRQANVPVHSDGSDLYPTSQQSVINVQSAAGAATSNNVIPSSQGEARSSYAFLQPMNESAGRNSPDLFDSSHESNITVLQQLSRPARTGSPDMFASSQESNASPQPVAGSARRHNSGFASNQELALAALQPSHNNSPESNAASSRALNEPALSQDMFADSQEMIASSQPSSSSQVWPLSQIPERMDVNRLRTESNILRDPHNQNVFPAPVSPLPSDSSQSELHFSGTSIQLSSSASQQQMPQNQVKFLQFAEKHRTVLNQILRQSSTPLLEGPFKVLVNHTRVLDFDVKRRYFRSELERADEGHRREELAIHVKRDHVFEESFRELHRRPADDWKHRFYIVFEGEEGQDAGGLLREWYMIISRDIFNPMYALFCTSPSDKVTYTINELSHCNPNHLCYFKFVGRVIAKAIYDNKLLECYFTRSFYKHILGIPVKYTDMESQDINLYNGLMFIMENNVSALGSELTFSTDVSEFGVTDVRELIKNGRNVVVTDQNKMEYINLVCQMKMTGAIRKQLNAFLDGFYDIIPKKLISIFNEQELELLISGLPTVDIEDLRANTEYYKYQEKSLQIQWFWRALREFDQAERAKFLQFVTGTSKVPLQGFAALEGMNGVQKFQIHRDERSTDRLPSAHTCFNQLDLPVYETYTKLKQCLLKAISECSEGFGFA